MSHRLALLADDVADKPGLSDPAILWATFGLIAALLIGLWVGAKPNKRTYEMLCHYLSGWATAEEVERHLLKLREKSTGPPSNS